MTDQVTKFCESVHGKLESLVGRMDSLKLNIGTTWHFLHEKLGEVRRHREAARQPLTEARTNLERWFKESQTETESTIDQWGADRDTPKLAARAHKAEEHVWTAIQLAEASIDDTERMILEAISAKLDAEAVGQV